MTWNSRLQMPGTLCKCPAGNLNMSLERLSGGSWQAGQSAVTLSTTIRRLARSYDAQSHQTSSLIKGTKNEEGLMPLLLKSNLELAHTAKGLLIAG